MPPDLEAEWRQQPVPRLLRWFWILSAVATTGIGLFFLYYALTLPWFEQEAFDILGVLFLLSNLPRLFCWAATFLCLPVAAALWYSAYRGNAGWLPRYRRGVRIRR